MWTENAKIERLDTSGRRIIVISDIHANLQYFTALLKKIELTPDDVLVLCGDFLEKGERSLDTLRYIMQLSKDYDVHPLCGNCDGWQDSVDGVFPAKSLRSYLLSRKSGLIWDMLTDCGVSPDEETDIPALLPMLAERYSEEFAFLRALPHVIETPHCIFVHGGIRPDVPIGEQMAGDCMKFDDFMSQGYSFDKWVIVGHWPVMLYLKDRVCANPIIDRTHRIISIDGGCVLKDDGQLNALVIPHEGSEDFHWQSWDSFPTAKVRTGQSESRRSYYIRWGDNRVQVLHRGDEFSHCRHVRTGYEMDILTKYLYGDGELVECNDCTDYEPELKPGDTVSIVERTSRGYFVKHNGTSGWYHGEIYDEL